jgi:predicted YcjX-like family ATPase
MPLLPFKTAERRIGILGPGWSGKTIFLTSLINHLSCHDPRYFHLGKGRASAEVRKFRKLDQDRGWPEFEYEKFRERLVHRRWPKKTRDSSQYVCRFERSDWTFYDMILKLYDLPGERINDFGMLKKGSDTFADWSDTFMKRLDRDISYADRFEGYLKRLDDPAISEEQILHSYKATLGRLRLAYKPYLTPSTFALNREGEPPPAGRDPEQLASERYVGLRPGDEFAPLPREARRKHPLIAGLFAQRFDRYADHVVAPLVAALRSCHGLVILVDILQLLATDTATRDDYQELLRDMLRALDPKENLLYAGLRKVSEALLPHQVRPSWISRIAFVAPKADLVHPEDRNRLKHLLRTMVERDARDLDGIKCDYFNVAAVRATESAPGGEARRLLMGSTMLDAAGHAIDPGERQKYMVSPLPDEWLHHWRPGDFVFPSVYPQIPPRKDCAPDHVGLDEVFNFLCG